MVPFGGYILPVQYPTGVIKEHMAVRTQAGLFDVSHMGEILCEGEDALANLQMILTNNFDNMKDGQARYSPMCNEKGGTVDDLIVYKKADNQYFIVVNAANKDKDYQWSLRISLVRRHLRTYPTSMRSLRFRDLRQWKSLGRSQKKRTYQRNTIMRCSRGKWPVSRALFQRPGIPGRMAWNYIWMPALPKNCGISCLRQVRKRGLIPCGLGARDTLRMEAAMPLYGHEMDDEVTPLETGLGFAVKMAKEDFVGKDALIAQGEPKRKRIGLKVTGRGIIREHQDVYVDGKVIGHTTSGTHCPFLGYPIGMALVDAAYTEEGAKVEVEVRGRMVEALVVALPFYKKKQISKEKMKGDDCHGINGRIAIFEIT